MEKKTMQALVYRSPHDYDLEEVPVPKIVQPQDAIGKVTLSAICTSDIHLVQGHILDVKPPKIPGHEFCVEIVEVGPEVKRVRPGLRYVLPPGISCGRCMMCKNGIPALCMTPGMGMFGLNGPDGAHAEYIRIPYADYFCLPIPDGLGEEDVILVPDMLATGWFGVKNAEVNEEKRVAVIGVGPVGISACLLAKKVFGAKAVYAVDRVEERLNLLEQNGLVEDTILAQNRVLEQIMDLTGGVGVDSVIETAGTEATFLLAAQILRAGGILSTVSVFPSPITIPIPLMVNKNLTVRMGIHRGEGIMKMLKMIQEGKLNAKFMLTHRSPLKDIKKGYEVFGQQKEGCIKWLIVP